MEYHTLIQQLGRTYGLDGLQLDEELSCVLQFNDDIHIKLRFEPDEGDLHLYAALGPAQLAKRSELMTVLLDSNNDIDALDGACFAMNPAQNEVILRREIAICDQSPESLPHDIASLAGLSQSWRAKLIHRELIAA